MRQAFCETYADSRALFMAEARRVGARLESHPHAEVRGPAGETVYTDVAEIGPPAAGKALLLTTGVHGLEGLAGAGVVVSALRAGAFEGLGGDLKAVLVHAVNPWGVAHQARTTENNVDLNRNFLAAPFSAPANPEYEAADGIFSGADLDVAIADLDREMDRQVEAGTADRWIDAVFCGQYSRPAGVAYGGARPEWSNTTMLAIARARLGQAAYVAHIDWHTGLGAYGQPLPIAFHPPGSEALRSLARWCDFDPAGSASGFDSGRVPEISGLMVPALGAFVGSKAHFGMVVEFGTRTNAEMFRSYILDRWLRFEGPRQPRRAARVRAELIECYYPADAAWRARVAEGGRRLVAGVLAGLREL